MQQLEIADGPRQPVYTGQSGRFDDSSSVTGAQSHHSGGGVNLIHGQPGMGAWFDSDV